MVKETVLSVILATFGFLIYLSYDITPLIFLGGLGFVLYILLERKGLLNHNSVAVNVTHTPIKFDDIGGQNPAKQELKEALEFILNFDQVREMGIRPLKGILLTGPPGTGKTMLAKAAATFTDSVFLATSGSDFIEMYAGVGAQRVRKLFQSARQQAEKEKKTGAIIFIDEIDVLGGKRGSHAGHLEYDQTLNQLLVEMDGIKSQQLHVLIIGATNRVDLLDPALLRPGRFDRIVKVDLPEKKSRLHILKLHTANKPLDEDVNLEKIAQETFGFSGAQLENVCNEAAIYAMRDSKKAITQRHFKDAVDKVMMGEKAERSPSEDEKTRIAIHETGHALVSEKVRPNSVSYVTITSRGSALGYVRQNPGQDTYLYTKEYLEGQIKIALAGAIAEEILIGNKSSGSFNDFQQALKIARQIVETGLSDLGIVDTAMISKEKVHEELSRIISEQEIATRCVIEENIEVMRLIIDILLEEENMSGEQLHAIISPQHLCA